MSARNLLHKNDLQKFLEYCQAAGHETREGKDFWQVAQIRLKGERAWHVLYQRAHMPEHLTVTNPLIKTAVQFYREKHANKVS